MSNSSEKLAGLLGLNQTIAESLQEEFSFAMKQPVGGEGQPQTVHDRHLEALFRFSRTLAELKHYGISTMTPTGEARFLIREGVRRESLRF